MRNKLDYFTLYRHSTLMQKQAILEVGELSCIHTGTTFTQEEVDAYNTYTKSFNKASNRPMQEMFLDQRAMYFKGRCHRYHLAQQDLIYAAALA